MERRQRPLVTAHIHTPQHLPAGLAVPTTPSPCFPQRRAWREFQESIVDENTNPIRNTTRQPPVPSRSPLDSTTLKAENIAWPGVKWRMSPPRTAVTAMVLAKWKPTHEWLMYFIPLVVASGGNSGNQAATLVITALSTGDCKLADWPRILRREFALGLLLGGLLAIPGYCLALAYAPSAAAALVIYSTALASWAVLPEKADACLRTLTTISRAMHNGLRHDAPAMKNRGLCCSNFDQDRVFCSHLQPTRPLSPQLRMNPNPVRRTLPLCRRRFALCWFAELVFVLWRRVC